MLGTYLNNVRGTLESLAAQLATLRSLTLTLVTMICVALMAAFVIKSVLPNERLIVEPIHVPEQLKSAGADDEAISRRLSDKLLKLTKAAATSRSKFAIEIPHVVDDIEIPETGVSLEALASQLQEFFGLRRHTLTGEIVTHDNELRLFLRVRRRGGTESQCIEVANTDLECLLEQGALSALKEFDPFTLASYYSSTDDTAKCEDSIQHCLSHAPSDDDAWAYNLWGILLDRKQDYGGAIDKYEAAIRLNPSIPNPYLNWGLALEGQDNFDGALQQFKLALKVDPDYAPAYACWGGLLMFQKKYGEAMTYFHRAIRQDSCSIGGHIGASTALMHLKEFEQASEMSRKAVVCAPESAEAHLSVGETLLQAKKYSQVLEECTLAIQLRRHRPFPEAQTLCAKALRAEGKYQEAEGMCRQALIEDPRLVDGHMTMGIVLLDQGKLDQALPEFQEVMELDKNSAYGNYLLATVLERLGRVAEARVTCHWTLELEDETGEAHKGCKEILSRSNDRSS